jgi:flagellar biosynthesis/type III secretory pathway protein FliH
LFKGRILKKDDAALYRMPSLEGDIGPLSKEDISQSTEELQRKAYEEGFASGERAGFSDGEQKAAILIERLGMIIEEIAIFKENMVKETEDQVVDLAVAVARKILIEEISERPEVIVTVVREALKKLQRMGTITIKINPSLYDLFMKKKSELIDIHEDIIFDVNANVSLTGPLVISETEEVVTDIDAMIANIIEDINIVKARKTDGSTQIPEPGPQDADYRREHSGQDTDLMVLTEEERT